MVDNGSIEEPTSWFDTPLKSVEFEEGEKEKFWVPCLYENEGKMEKRGSVLISVHLMLKEEAVTYP